MCFRASVETRHHQHPRLRLAYTGDSWHAISRLRNRNFNRASESAAGCMNRPGRMRRGSIGCWQPARGPAGRPPARWGVGIRPVPGPQPTRVQPENSRTQGPEAGELAAYAGVAGRAAARRRGGARARREGGAWRRRWVRIRSIAGAWVMHPTTRIASPHRGQRSGSTSKIRRSSSAQPRRPSASAAGTASVATAGAGCALRTPRNQWMFGYDRLARSIRRPCE